MMFSVSETGKIEKLLSISVTDLKEIHVVNNIKKIRKKRGLTQKQLSESVNSRHVGNGKKCSKGKQFIEAVKYTELFRR